MSVHVFVFGCPVRARLDGTCYGFGVQFGVPTGNELVALRKLDMGRREVKVECSLEIMPLVEGLGAVVAAVWCILEKRGLFGHAVGYGVGARR
jgi:hypothetical protein